jgi:hypothetical protein
VEFTGSGFAPRERIVSWATAPDQAVLSGPDVVANADGTLQTRFRVPGNGLSGRWAFTLHQRSNRASAVATFEVIGQSAGAAPLQAAVAPTVGPPGTSFQFAARGFKAAEILSYWVTAPDGTIFAARPEALKSDKNGRVDFRWGSPADAPSGIYVMTVQGIKSNVARGVAFEIRR